MPTKKQLNRQQRARRIILDRRANWSFADSLKFDGYDLRPGETTADKIAQCDLELDNLAAKGVK